MGWSLRRFPLTKAVPLAISRGTTSAVERLELCLSHDGITGRGETGGLDTGHRSYGLDGIEAELQSALPALNSLDPADRSLVDPLLSSLSPPARCAVDLVLWDWWGQWLQQPVWRLFGLNGRCAVATSVTLGLASVEGVQQRLHRWWTQLPATRIKLKLGSPDGLDHDRALLRAVASMLQTRKQQTGEAHELQVDANGGWTVQQAMAMQADLVAADVVLLEQPVAASLDPQEDLRGFAALREHCSMPLVADESCWELEDLLRLAPHVDGVNLKLLKTGGLTEALLMAKVAARLDLDLMVGCYSDSTLLNGAACQLLPLIRWPDLDSHLNLLDDPYLGLPLDQDRLSPPFAAGLGISCKPMGSN
tara:strand:+ start:419 stop:1507 length:1089 start_codon:yes stop_codon:yes gene_type:complete